MSVYMPARLVHTVRKLRKAFDPLVIIVYDKPVQTIIGFEIIA